MKRILLWLTLTIIALATAYAEPITPERAHQIAQQQMQKSPQGLRSGQDLALIKTEYIDARMLRSSNAEIVAYYVFNRSDHSGFVIVAGDDRLSEVLGYSYSGSFRTENMPTNLAYWMNGYKEILAAVIDGTGTLESAPTSLRASKAPLLDAKNIKWNQDSPWNVSTPKISGENPPIGCVATAMGQIMAYHRWPTEAEGVYTRYTINDESMTTTDGTSYDFSGHRYDWDAILKYATPRTTNAANKAIVGDYMIDVANAVNMAFDLDGSGAFDNDALHAFRSHFRYKHIARIELRAMYSDPYWREMLNRELDADRPIFYTGGGGDGGHAFVCDGYAEDGKYHFNWGWGGYGDGYYALTGLIPTETGAGAGSGNFTQNQQIIADLMPALDLNDRGNLPTPRPVLGYFGMYNYQLSAVNTSSGIKLSYYLSPQVDYKVSLSSRLLCYDPDGSVVEELSLPIQNSNDLLFLFVSMGSVRIPLSKYELNKEYTYKCVYKIAGTDEWIQAMPIPLQNSEIKITRTSDTQCSIKHIARGQATSVTPIVPETVETQILKVYPTVATDNLYVDLGQGLDGTVSLIDIQGSVVRSLETKGQSKLNINISDLPVGTYFVRLNNAVARFIVKQ